MTTPWEAYRAANPMLAEMREYNTRVRDRVVLKKARKPTSPSPADEEAGPTDEFLDRYKALGISYPDPKTMCKGECEGTGIVPIYGRGYKDEEGNCRPVPVRDANDPREDAYQKRWDEAEGREATDDGYHFVKCLDCEGTGKRPGAEEAKETLSSCIEDLKTLLG